MQKGTIIFWNAQKGFGFISVRTGNLIEKFFIHSSRITYSEVDLAELQPGYFAHFNISPLAPRRVGDARFATDVRIYKDPNENVSAFAGVLSGLAGTEAMSEVKS
jgi:cold shock CspA family protein